MYLPISGSYQRDDRQSQQLRLCSVQRNGIYWELVQCRVTLRSKALRVTVTVDPSAKYSPNSQADGQVVSHSNTSRISSSSL